MNRWRPLSPATILLVTGGLTVGWIGFCWLSISVLTTLRTIPGWENFLGGQNQLALATLTVTPYSLVQQPSPILVPTYSPQRYGQLYDATVTLSQIFTPSPTLPLAQPTTKRSPTQLTPTPSKTPVPPTSTKKPRPTALPTRSPYVRLLTNHAASFAQLIDRGWGGGEWVDSGGDSVAWSPNGELIVYVATDNHRHVIHVDGSGDRLLGASEQLPGPANEWENTITVSASRMPTLEDMGISSESFVHSGSVVGLISWGQINRIAFITTSHNLYVVDYYQYDAFGCFKYYITIKPTC